MPDLAKLYSSLHTTWDKVRVDILSHAFLVAILFVAGVTPPPIQWPVADVNAVMNLPVYKLAKDVNVIVLAPAALLVALLVYGLVVRTIGQTLAIGALTTLRPPTGNTFVAGNVLLPDLITIAVLLKRTDFTEDDLTTQVTMSAVRYGTESNDKLRDFDPARQYKDASLYLGYAILFPICWLALFTWIPPGSGWRAQNSGTTWLVLSLFLLFLLRNWARAREYHSQLPAIFVNFLASKVRSDPAWVPALDAARPRLAEIEARVESIRLAALREAAAPSLYGFIKSRTRDSDASTRERYASSGQRFWLFHWYNEGKRFSRNEQKYVYDSHWLKAFGKYCFYKAASSFGRLFTLALALLVNLVGMDVWLRGVARRQRELGALRLSQTLRETERITNDLKGTTSHLQAFAEQLREDAKHSSDSEEPVSPV